MINLKDLDLQPIKGFFFSRVGDTFEQMSHIKFKKELCSACNELRYINSCGWSDFPPRSALLKIEHLSAQLDPDKGEYITLMMYPPEEWYYEKE